MISRQGLDKIEVSIREIKTAQAFLQSMNEDKPFVVLPFRDPITIVFSDAQKKEIHDRVSELETKLQILLKNHLTQA